MLVDMPQASSSALEQTAAGMLNVSRRKYSVLFGQALLDSPSGEFDAIVQLQFAQRVLYVVLHRSMRHHEALGNLFRTEPLSHQAKHLRLTIGEHWRLVRWLRSHPPVLTEH